jgi:hypothetical protein
VDTAGRAKGKLTDVGFLWPLADVSAALVVYVRFVPKADSSSATKSDYSMSSVRPSRQICLLGTDINCFHSFGWQYDLK